MKLPTFFEHGLNSLIDTYCSRNKIDLQIKNDIIRSTHLRAKLTWLLKLMQFPKIKKRHAQTIINLSDKRNSFIHFKWNPLSFKTVRINRKLNKSFYKEVENTITYFKGYISRVEYKGKKGEIEKIFEVT